MSLLRGETKGPLAFEANDTVIVLDIQSANDGTVKILGQIAAQDQHQWTGPKWHYAMVTSHNARPRLMIWERFSVKR